jgi:hypothetical protein
MGEEAQNDRRRRRRGSDPAETSCTFCIGGNLEGDLDSSAACTSPLLPTHCLLNFYESSQDLLVVLPPTHNLQTYRSVGVHLRVIELVAELVLGILGLVVDVLGVLLRVHGRNREYNTGVIEQVPVRRVAPVLRLTMRRGGSEGRRAEDNVHFLAVSVCVCGGGPGLGVGGAVGFSLGGALRCVSVCRGVDITDRSVDR